MVSGPVLIDTNVLVSYVAGPTGRSIITARKRCSTLRAAVLAFREQHAASPVAAARVDFRGLRLTDRARLAAASPGLHLLTVDLDLYLASLREGRLATNFSQVIDSAS